MLCVVYSECRVFVKTSIIELNVAMLSVIMLNVVRLSVLAPF